MLRAFIFLLALSTAGPAFSERRVALVIGNSDYQHATRLPNPQNDARGISVVAWIGSRLIPKISVSFRIL